MAVVMTDDAGLTRQFPPPTVPQRAVLVPGGVLRQSQRQDSPWISVKEVPFGGGPWLWREVETRTDALLRRSVNTAQQIGDKWFHFTRWILLHTSPCLYSHRNTHKYLRIRTCTQDRAKTKKWKLKETKKHYGRDAKRRRRTREKDRGGVSRSLLRYYWLNYETSDLGAMESLP